MSYEVKKIETDRRGFLRKTFGLFLSLFVAKIAQTSTPLIPLEVPAQVLPDLSLNTALKPGWYGWAEIGYANIDGMWYDMSTPTMEKLS